VYFCLPNITNPMYIEQLRETFPPPSENTVAVCNQITFLISYSISSRLVTLLKITDAPIPVSDVFLSFCKFKFINFCHKLAIKTFLFLLTITCISPLDAKCIVEFKWQKRLSESATTLLYKYSILTLSLRPNFYS